MSKSKGREYYYNLETNTTRWDHPLTPHQEQQRQKPDGGSGKKKKESPQKSKYAPPTPEEIAAALAKLPASTRRHTFLHHDDAPRPLLQHPVAPLRIELAWPKPTDVAGIKASPLLFGEWREHVSKSHQRHFWTSTKTGEKVWTRPSGPSSQSHQGSGSGSPYKVGNHGQWDVFYSIKFSRRFYKHSETGELTWHNPFVEGEVGEAEAKAGTGTPAHQAQPNTPTHQHTTRHTQT